MSRGLGTIQREIIRILSGKGMQRFRSGSGSFDTGELLEELVARGLLENHQRKVAMSAVRRACDGLVYRGMVQGQYEPDMNNPGRTTIQWSLAPD